MSDRIYFDHVSSTRPHPEVLKTYNDLLNKYYVNSDALYSEGVDLYLLLEKARKSIASLLGVDASDLIFTSGASESNNAVIKGLAFADGSRKHLITSAYEHSSILSCMKQMERVFGYEVTYLKPGKDGCIAIDDVLKALREDTLLVSIMQVNNEMGAVNDIEGIMKAVKENSKAHTHSDITQGFCKLPLNTRYLDSFSCSAHKIHGLKGSGLLYLRHHIPFEPLIIAGQQEAGRRGGTSNAPVDIVLAKTIRLELENNKKHHQDLTDMMGYLENGLKDIEDVTIVSPKDHIPNLITVITPLTSEVMMNTLDKAGIELSSRSTCGTRSEEPSYTALAMNYPAEHAIRISLDYNNTKEEIDYLLKTMKESIIKYR